MNHMKIQVLKHMAQVKKKKNQNSPPSVLNIFALLHLLASSWRLQPPLDAGDLSLSIAFYLGFVGNYSASIWVQTNSEVMRLSLCTTTLSLSLTVIDGCLSFIFYDILSPSHRTFNLVISISISLPFFSIISAYIYMYSFLSSGLPPSGAEAALCDPGQWSTFTFILQ